MDDQNILTAIDVGTTKVCTLVARISSKGNVDILGVGIVPSQGLRKGTVVDVQEAKKAVRASIEQAEQKAGVQVRSAYIGVTGSHIESWNQWVPVGAIGDGNAVITSRHLEQIRHSAQISETQPERQLLHTIPRRYALDGMKGIRNPVGMHAQQMEMETHMITGASPLIRTLVESVEQARVVMQGLVLEPLASGEAVLSKEEKELGVILVDVGGGTSDMAVFQDGTLLHTAVIPVGGYQFTNDISTVFDTPFDAAEAAKLKYGHTNPELVDLKEEVELPVFGQDRVARVSRREFCQVIKERAQEMLQMVELKLEQASLGGMPEARVVLTGGTANLPGLESMARRILSASVRVGVPRQPKGIPDMLVNPAYSTSVGILLWCMKEYSQATSSANGNHGLTGYYRRLVSWLIGRVRRVSAPGPSLGNFTN